MLSSNVSFDDYYFKIIDIFGLIRCQYHIATLNPTGVILVVSSTTGEGIDLWCDLIARRFEAKQKS